MKLSLIMACLLQAGLGASWAEGRDAVKALVPGLAHFSAERDYRGLAFAGSQVTFLFLAAQAFGKRESSALGTRHALDEINQSRTDNEKEFYRNRAVNLNDDVKKYELLTGAYAGAFLALYVGSIVDAYFMPAKAAEEPESLTFNWGWGLSVGDSKSFVALSKSF